jgi:hypothetical protein
MNERTTTGHKTCRFQWVSKRFVPHQVLCRGILTHPRNPARFIPATVSKNAAGEEFQFFRIFDKKMKYEFDCYK